jgi:hypothetical protein
LEAFYRVTRDGLREGAWDCRVAPFHPWVRLA